MRPGPVLGEETSPCLTPEVDHSPPPLPLPPPAPFPPTLSNQYVQILHLVKAAGVKVAELGEKLKAALEVHETARVAARVRRRQPQATPAASRNVTLQGSASVAGHPLPSSS